MNSVRAMLRGLKSIVRANRLLAAGFLVFIGLGLSACGGGFDLGVGDWFDGNESNTPGVTSEDLAALSKGGAKIALLLPLSANGGAADVARALKEAGELAVFEAGQAGIVLTTKDTLGTPAGAQAAAQAAINEGAELIIGPLFSSSVKAVAPIAQGANVPVIAFSTDRNVATQGVYLLSFLPDLEVDRVIEHAVASGRRNFAALVPKSPYGAVVERALVTAAKKRGAKIVAVQRYARNEQALQAPAKTIARAVLDGSKNVQGLLVAEGGNLLRSIDSVFAQEGVNGSNVKLLGTGLWNETGVNSLTSIVGGWYAGPPPSAKSQFGVRFRNAYGREPPRLASLAYDAVSLSIALARFPPDQRFTAAQLTNPEGFSGVDGLFRFRSNGLNNRGLSVMEVTGQGPREVSTAPPRFQGS